jgi:hypothetical protein
VWNLPIDVTFKSTNPQGWPRLVVSVYCQDLFGRYVVRGYGSTLIPTVPGRYVRYIRCFTPVASTLLQGLLGWMTGSTPEVRGSPNTGSVAGDLCSRSWRLLNVPTPPPSLPRCERPAVLRQQDRRDQ